MNMTNFDPYQAASVGDEFSIPSCRGLRLRVGVNSRTWFMRYRQPSTIAGVGGKLREGRLGLLGTGQGYLTIIQAIAAWQEKKDLLAKGVDPFGQEKAAKAEQRSQKEIFGRHGTTVGQMMERWMTSHSDNNARGWEVRRMIEQELGRQPAFAALPAGDLRLHEVDAFLEAIIARGAPRIAGMTRQTMGQAFEWAAGKELVPDTTQNQFKRALKGDKRISQRKKDRTLNNTELAMFYPWLPVAGISKNVQSILRLILLTGMRPGEVASMAWGNIDLEGGSYLLSGNKTKTGKGREVQLSRQAVALLRTLKDDRNNFVFEAYRASGKSFGKPMTTNSINVGLSAAKMPRPVVGDAEQWTPHDLRRTVRTGLAALGCPMEVGELILGHAVGSGVEQTYNLHRYLPDQKLWLQKWADHLDSLQK